MTIASGLMTKGNHLALIFLLLMVGIWATACGRMRTASPSGKVVPTVVSQEITPQNAVRLKPVARWGAGRMNGMALSPGRKDSRGCE
jgi:hypothetical protein